MEEYIRVVMALLREETAETEIEGKRRLIRFLNPELGLINTHDPIGLYIAASGPRARQLTVKLGSGWINNLSADMAPAAALIGEMRSAWSASGHGDTALDAVVQVSGVVLEENEPADSPRAIAQRGRGPRYCSTAPPTRR